LHCHHQFPHGFFDAFEEIVTKCDSFIGGNVVYMKGEEEGVIVEERNREAREKLMQHGFNIHSIDLSHL